MSGIPVSLKKKIDEGRCILFIGAGASMDAVDAQGNGLPHWGQLLIELLELIQEMPDPDPPDVVREIQGMLQAGDFMAVSEWIEHRLGHHQFQAHMLRRLSTARYSKVHETLAPKPFKAVMTTNYDRLIEIHWEIASRNPFVVVPQSPQNIAVAREALRNASDMTPVVRAHGSLADPSSLIFFPRTYREIMFNNEPFRLYVSTVFREFTVLFVGTSFRDPNFQSLLQWIYTITGGREGEHYAILDERGPVFKRYMKSNFNVNFITYDASAGHHAGLLPLLAAL